MVETNKFIFASSILLSSLLLGARFASLKAFLDAREKSKFSAEECPSEAVIVSRKSIDQGIVKDSLVVLGSSADKYRYDYPKAAIPFYDRTLKYKWKHPDKIELERLENTRQVSGFGLAYSGNAIAVKQDNLRQIAYTWMPIDTVIVDKAGSGKDLQYLFEMRLLFDPATCKLRKVKAYDFLRNRRVSPIYEASFVVDLINSQVDSF